MVNLCSYTYLHSMKIDSNCAFMLASQSTWCNGGIDDECFFRALNMPPHSDLAPYALFESSKYIVIFPSHLKSIHNVLDSIVVDD